jgi:PfaB family protein
MKISNELALVGLDMAVGQGSGSARLHRMIYDGLLGEPEKSADAGCVDRLVLAAKADMKGSVSGRIFSDAALVTVAGETLPDFGPDFPHAFQAMVRESTCCKALERSDRMLGDEGVSMVFLVASGCAVVLKTPAKAREDGDRIYALIQGESDDPGAFEDPGTIAYMDIAGDSPGNFFPGDYPMLGARFGEGSAQGECACGFSVSFMQGVLKTALCLYHRFIPQAVDSQDPPLSWDNSPFYLPPASRTWFTGTRAPIRKALVSEKGAFQLIISEDHKVSRRVGRYLGNTPPYLFPVGGSSQENLKQRLDAFLTEVSNCTDLKGCAAQRHASVVKEGAPFTAVIVGATRDDVGREAGVMARALNNAFLKKQEIRTPGGSFFTPQPLGVDGKVVFVYPGVGSAYTGLGQDLFSMFPGVFDAFGGLVPNVGEHLMERLFYPRHSRNLTDDELKTMDRNLRTDIMNISRCGMSWSVIYTMILGGYLGLVPDCAMGYSMGEASMMASMMVWKNPADLGVLMNKSDLFSRALSGELTAVRDDWNLPRAVEDENERIWESYTLLADRSAVEKAVEKEDRVYITLINTDREVVIAGAPENCIRVAENLGCRYFPLRLDLAIHSGPAHRVYDRLVALYDLELGEKTPVKFYSSSCYLPVPIRRRSVAHSIAKAFCDTVDFPRLVNRVYDDGGRIFIEVGPRQTCCQWISESLKDKPHVTVPLNIKGVGDKGALVRAMAQLVSHGVQMDISCLFKF